MGRLVSVWLQLEIWTLTVLVTRGEIRCYCDAPHCVATGYMCKSDLNACFTRVLDPQSPKSPLSHGCYEPLLNAGAPCRPEPGLPALYGPIALECCHEDMCNYRGLHHLTHSRGESPDGRTRSRAAAHAPEAWFRAAVVAVPVAGGLVLVLLIALALRMLRGESRRLRQQRREMLSRLHYGFQGQQLTRGRGAKLDRERMVPSGGHATRGKDRRPEPGGTGLLALVHWGRHGARGRTELV